MTNIPTNQLLWLRKFIEENFLLVLWNAVLFCGGSILLFYHASLLYLPDFNLSDLVGLIASVTFIGIFFLIFFISICFIPGLALRWIYSEWALIPYRGYFEKPSERIILIILPVVLWSFYLFVPDDLRRNWSNFTSPPAFFVSILICSGITSLFLSWHTVKLIRFSILRHLPFWRNIIGLFLWTFLLFFPIQISFIFAEAGESETKFFIVAGSVLFLTLFNGIVFTVPKRNMRQVLVGASLITALLIPLMSGQSLFFPRIVMQVLSLGNRNAATLTITGKNCYSLKRFGINCSEADSKDGAIELENVNILSRIGTGVLVELLVNNSADPVVTEKESGSELPQDLKLKKDKTSLFCPTRKGKNGECQTCDSLTLKYAGNDSEDHKFFEDYKKSLICVQLIIPKEQILNFSLASRRYYSGYTTYLLPRYSKEIPTSSQRTK